MRKGNKTITVGGAYDSLPALSADRGLDLQLFVDSYVDIGVGVDAFFASGGEGSKDKAKKTAYELLKRPEIQQAVTERSAQKFFDLAPTAVKVIKDILTDVDPKNMKIRAQVAMGVMDKLQVEQHINPLKKKKDEAIIGDDLMTFLKGASEFIRKNPEWQGNGGRAPIVIDGDVVVSTVEEHEPE